MNDHVGLTISSFRGTYNIEEEESIPMGYFRDSLNIRFLDKGVETRDGSSLVHTVSAVRRIAVYERIGEVRRLLILDGSGHLYDSTNLSTPILTIATMTDFSSVTIFDRAYITPHDGTTGLAGEKVYVYDGTGLARAAAGTAPASFTLTAADNGASGTVETGVHAIGVAYLTKSGFITKPGGFVEFTPLGGRKLDIGNLPLGGTSVSGRVLVATKAITDFTGDFQAQTYFFIPNGTIADNTTTSTTVDFYEADLLDDATYLLENLETIPAGVSINHIAGRLVVMGEDANASIIRVSPVGEPESHNAVDGFVTVNPGDAGAGVTNSAEYHGQILAAKSQRFYAVQPDDSAPPAEWSAPEIDGSVGTECHGIAQTLDHGETIQERIFVADRRGLRLFDGTFQDGNILTRDISGIWDRINKAAFEKVEIAVDPIEAMIYVAVPLDSATTPSVVLVGDYNQGLGVETIRWTTWDFPNDAMTIAIDLVSGIPVLKFGSLAGNVYKIDSTVVLDYSNAIDSYVEFPHLPISEEMEDIINHYAGCRVRVRGTGTLTVTGKGIDDSDTFTGESITLAATPGKSSFSGFNYTGERCSIKLRVNTASKYFTLTKFTLYAAPVWADRPRT